MAQHHEGALRARGGQEQQGLGAAEEVPAEESHGDLREGEAHHPGRLGRARRGPEEPYEGPEAVRRFTARRRGVQCGASGGQPCERQLRLRRRGNDGFMRRSAPGSSDRDWDKLYDDFHNVANVQREGVSLHEPGIGPILGTQWPFLRRHPLDKIRQFIVFSYKRLRFRGVLKAVLGLKHRLHDMGQATLLMQPRWKLLGGGIARFHIGFSRYTG